MQTARRMREPVCRRNGTCDIAAFRIMHSAVAASSDPSFQSRLARQEREELGRFDRSRRRLASMTLVEEGAVDARLLPSLRVHLDWIHYKHNFRDPVIVRRATNGERRPLDAGRDCGRSPPGRSCADAQATGAAPCRRSTPAPNAPDEAVPGGLHAAASEHHLAVQPAVLAAARGLGGGAGRGFEAALPSGASDANHPQAVADSVADFWTLLRDLDSAGPAAAGDLRPGDRRRLGARAPRPGSIGSRRSTRQCGHRVLRAAAISARRLLAGDARTALAAVGAARAARAASSRWTR